MKAGRGACVDSHTFRKGLFCSALWRGCQPACMTYQYFLTAFSFFLLLLQFFSATNVILCSSPVLQKLLGSPRVDLCRTMKEKDAPVMLSL